MPVLCLLSLISRNSPKQLGMVSPELPRGVTEVASHLDAGETVDEEGRRASYWRWVALVGSRKTWQRSVSFLGSLLNMVPKCQIGVVSSRPKSRCGENHRKNGGIEMISEAG